MSRVRGPGSGVRDPGSGIGIRDPRLVISDSILLRPKDEVDRDTRYDDGNARECGGPVAEHLVDDHRAARDDEDGRRPGITPRTKWTRRVGITSSQHEQ